ncbi:ABC transporter permease [Haloechinothrix halophila]|uniref:ABC transporter permease n=1 Tax=Haloechinothrix halophila TaxID=1069073 RepID=UPI000423C84B|nr:ABC transporter permease [Haloechinothrix halophila]
MTTASLIPVGAPSRGLAFQTRLVRNETAKGLRLMWHRRGMVGVGVLMNGLTYLGISFFIGGGHIVEPLMLLTLPALLAMTIAGTAALQGSGGVAEEIYGGTLEQTQLSPASPQVQVLGRIAALAIEGLAGAVVLGAVFALGFRLDYDAHLAAALPALLTVADALGYGLLIAALTVRVASIGAITHVFNMVIMVFGGMVVPITVFPGSLETVAQFVPTALGVQAFNTTLAGEPLATIWSDGTLPWLIVHSGLLVTLGLATYVANIRRARREGGLSPR